MPRSRFGRVAAITVAALIVTLVTGEAHAEDSLPIGGAVFTGGIGTHAVDGCESVGTCDDCDSAWDRFARKIVAKLPCRVRRMLPKYDVCTRVDDVPPLWVADFGVTETCWRRISTAPRCGPAFGYVEPVFIPSTPPAPTPAPAPAEPAEGIDAVFVTPVRPYIDLEPAPMFDREIEVEIRRASVSDADVGGGTVLHLEDFE